MKLKFLVSACAMSMLCGLSVGAQAAYPERPVKLIVPFTAGGPADNVARILSSALGQTLGQPLVVENRPGAGGVIGAAEVARAKPDGYTLGISNADSLITGPILVPTAGYDAAEDFTLISQVAMGRQTLVVNPEVPVETLPELVALAKEQPHLINYASFGPGSRPELIFGEVAAQSDVDWIGIPYKGMAQAVQDLLANRVQVALVPSSLAAEFEAKGLVRPIVVLGEERDPYFLPDVTTSVEQDLHTPIMDTHMWVMVFGPAGLPDEVSKKLAEAIQTALGTSEFQSQIRGAGHYAMPGHYGEQLQQEFLVEQDLIGGIVSRSMASAD